MTEERRDCRLTVGARHADQLQGGFRVAEETAGKLGKGATRISDLGGGDGGKASDGFARDDGGGAAGDGIIEERVTIRAQAR